MITKEQWAKLGQGNVVRYKRGKTWVLRTVLHGPADGILGCRRSSGGITFLKWQHSKFHNPTTTYFWNDLKDKVEWTGCKVKGGLATYPEVRRIHEMFGEKAVQMVEKRMDEFQKTWERIRKWHSARYSPHSAA